MDQLDSLYTTSKFLLPWAVFVIGLLGSLHCVGMCGGLVMSCAPTPKNNMFYQLGRLLSYSLLALLAGSITNYFSFGKNYPIASTIPGVFLGGILVYTGAKLIFARAGLISGPQFFSKFRIKLSKKVFPSSGDIITNRTSFFVGTFSILLPCGFLYGVILALAAFNSPILALISIFCFWVGTLPAMAFAPDVIKRILKPLYLKMPLVSSSFLIFIGLITIANRVAMAYQEVKHCH